MNPSTSTKNTLDERLSASRKTLETNFVFPATLGVIVVLIVIWIGSKIFAADIDGYWVNIFTDGIGIAITILVIDRLNDYRYARERKLALFRQVKSHSNDAAVEAVRQIQDEELWEEMLEYYRGNDKRIDFIGIKLDGANLWRGNLKKADLLKARLEQANLEEAELQEANLMQACLRRAVLWNANLEEGDLVLSNLQGANLTGANLRGANLAGANLQGANLTGANLRGANFRRIGFTPPGLAAPRLFDRKTILPDGTSWSPDTDMTRYTNPEHPDF